MTKNLITLQAALFLIRAVEAYYFLHPYISYPVMSGDRLLGLLTLEDIRKIPKERWGETEVAEVIEEVRSETTLSPKNSAFEAIERMVTLGVGRLLVIKDGRLVGIVTRRDIMKLLEARRRFKDLS